MTEAEKQDIMNQFKDIVSNGIAPILKTAGFKKGGNNFHAHTGKVDLCINIQKDRWGYDSYFNTWEFTINIGVTWNDYTMSLFDKACDFPLESSCPIRARIGKFMGKSDYWFVLRPNQDCSQTKDLICTTIKDKVLPILNNIKCLNDTWKYIAENSSWYERLTKLFHIESGQKVFWTTPIGQYMLCVATGKGKMAKQLMDEMKQRRANTELVDKIIERYEKLQNNKSDSNI